MGAVVPVDLPVLPVHVGLRQGAQALQKLRVKHQTIGLQDVLGQLQLCFGSDEAVCLIAGATGRGITTCKSVDVSFIYVFKANTQIYYLTNYDSVEHV